MPDNPMDLLLRLRRVAKEEAMRVLATRLDEEAAARRLVQAAEFRMTAERMTATDPNHGDGVVEAYVAWLPIGRKAERVARDFCDRATANVTVARAELKVAHAATEAALKFQEHQARMTRLLAARKSQLVLDEIASRLVPPT